MYEQSAAGEERQGNEQVQHVCHGDAKEQHKEPRQVAGDPGAIGQEGSACWRSWDSVGESGWGSDRGI